jgi:hypothetical protein
MIKFNEVTWYSKLCALLLFLVVFPALTFYIGMRYQEVISYNETELIPVSNWNIFVSNDSSIDGQKFSFSYPDYVKVEEVGGFDQVSVVVSWPQQNPTTSDTFIVFRPNYGGYGPEINDEILSTATEETLSGLSVKKVITDINTIYFLEESPVVTFNSLKGQPLTIANIEKLKPTQIEIWESDVALPNMVIRTQVAKDILETFKFIDN